MGDPKGVTVAVVGVIHGNEEAGLLITDELLNMQIPKGINLWVIPSMNPDGTALDRRGNANRVDLNRNFPYGWARIGQPGYWQYAGPRRASEVETQALVKFFREIKPALGLWYHQDLNIISPGVGFEGKLRSRWGNNWLANEAHYWWKIYRCCSNMAEKGPKKFHGLCGGTGQNS